MNLSFKTKGIPEAQAWLQNIATGFKNQALLAFSQYLVGDDSGVGYTHGLRHYPAYKYITMQQAYGGFVSDKQRRYVMMKIRSGEIDPGVPHRTGEFQRGWQYVTSPNSIKVTNDTPYGKYLMGDQQANMPRMGGWRQMMDVINSNLQGAIQFANRKVRDWLATQQ